MRNLGLPLFFAFLIMAQSPADPTAEITSALRAHRYEQAVKLAQAALEKAPNDVRVLAMEGMALSGLGNEREALAAYHKALGLKPDYLAALEGASQLEYQGDREHAIGHLDQLLKLQPGNATAHAMRAVMAWKRLDCVTAVRHFASAGNAISSEPDALQQYVACLARLERPADAIPVLRRLAILLPADRLVRYRLAAAQFMAKAYTGAIETLGPLMEGSNADADAFDLASAAWEALTDTPRAVAALRQAIVLAPADTRLYVDFASLCLIHKSYQTGIDMVTAGLARSPNAPQLYVARGILYVQMAQYEKSDADFAMAERLDPRQPFGSFARSLSQVQQNDFDKALATVREQLKKQPDDASLHYLLAQILSSQGAQVGSAEFNDAIHAASRAVELKPDLTVARDLLGRLYLESDQTTLAIEQCRLALRDNPTDPTALYHLIRGLQKSSQAGASGEISSLLKRFNEVRQQLAKQEADEARYQLVVGPKETDPAGHAN